jgi:glycerol uptake facilitator-like aquaporin
MVPLFTRCLAEFLGTFVLVQVGVNKQTILVGE